MSGDNREAEMKEAEHAARMADMAFRLKRGEVLAAWEDADHEDRIKSNALVVETNKAIKDCNEVTAEANRDVIRHRALFEEHMERQTAAMEMISVALTKMAELPPKV